jgi:DNA-binding NarL/FixJ family response regulator
VARLVVIDDHEALRGGLEAMLGQSGHEVVGSAGNVAAAYDLVEHAEPELALIDVRMPDGSGIDLTRDLLLFYPDLRIILYTGEADADLAAEALDAGARGYVLKAGAFDELLSAIAQVGGGGAYVDPRLDRSAAPAAGRVLSPREREVIGLMAEGLTAEQIGARLGVSVETVRTHVRNVIRKLHARNRVHAIAIALERGEVALGTALDE